MAADTLRVGDYDPVTAAEDDGALCPEHDAQQLYCTRPAGHEGEHVACVPGNIAAAVWS